MYEYSPFHQQRLPQEFIDDYKLKLMFDENIYVYMEIQRGMYGFKQEGKTVNEKLKQCLQPHGYKPYRNTPGLWKHNTKTILFTFIVNNFGVKCTHKKDAQELLRILQ